MTNAVVRFAFAVALTVFSLGTAFAADIETCKNFAKFASQNAKEVRALGGCFLNLSDRTLSTDYTRQFRWCIGEEDTQHITAVVDALMKQTDKCKRCQDYARIVTGAAQANIQNNCGLTSSIDNRWKPDYNYHMKGCMEAQHYLGTSFAPSPWEYVLALDTLAGEMLLEIERCKKTHPVAICRTCHITPQSTALMPAALRPPPKRGSHDFSVARQPPSIKRDGTSSGDSDKAQPSGERRRTPSGGSSTSAMDRLGGGTSATPSGGAGSSGGSAARPSGGGGASSAPAGGSSAPNIGRNTIMEPGATPGQLRGPGLR
jgi:hypothetical protein